MEVFDGGLDFLGCRFEDLFVLGYRLFDAHDFVGFMRGFEEAGDAEELLVAVAESFVGFVVRGAGEQGGGGGGGGGREGEEGEVFGERVQRGMVDEFALRAADGVVGVVQGEAGFADGVPAEDEDARDARRGEGEAARETVHLNSRG